MELHEAPAGLAAEELAARIDRRAARERELVVDRGLFLALKASTPDLASVRFA